MGSTYITKKCPNCGRIYEREYHSGYVKKDALFRYKYGCPLKICDHCHMKFIDHSYREIELDGVRPIDRKILTLREGMYGSIAILTGIYLLFGRSIIFGLLFLASGLILFGSVFTYKRDQRRLDEEAKASRKRLEDPQYAIELKRYGYFVPKKYLPVIEEEEQ